MLVVICREKISTAIVLAKYSFDACGVHNYDALTDVVLIDVTRSSAMRSIMSLNESCP